jgi:hypothetical protein
MYTEALERHFAAIGARVEIEGDPLAGGMKLDVRADRRGGHFAIVFHGGRHRDLEIIDVDRRGRHLLLLARAEEEKSKFLCGYDERHWFVAAVPETARGVTGVATAKIALQPDLVRSSISRTRPKDQFRRSNAAYVRQGEWFFVRAPRVDPPDTHILRDEPLRRAFGTPHIMERAFRRGGERVYVAAGYGRGLTQGEFDRLPENVRRRADWVQMQRDPEVYASGAVRHPDHATVRLDGWHRVAMNTEQSARAMRHVVFLD